MGIPILVRRYLNIETAPRAPFQYPIRRRIVRSRKASKPRNFCFHKLFDRSEIWHASRQQCCEAPSNFQSDAIIQLNYHPRGFNTSRDFTIRRLIGYWNGAQYSERYYYDNALLQASMVHLVTYTGSHINKKNVEKKKKKKYSSSLRYPGMEVDLHVRDLLDIK